MKKIKVGYLWDSYPHQRNIIDRVEQADYKKVFDFYKFRSYLAFIPKKLKLPNAESKFMDVKFGYDDFEINKVDILHFFNNISYGKTPWVSTFETFVPRISILLDDKISGEPINNKKVRKSINALASSSCKQIIAMSKCTAEIELNLLKDYPDQKEIIEQKMTIIHPPQDLLINSYDEKTCEKDDRLSFILVGGDFFRKGGLEVLLTFEKLVKENDLNIQLTIVSKLDAFDYATKSGEAEIRKAEEIINQNLEWITWYKQLSNEKVLDLMKSHQVGLLPTWADTYGYSVLELQASGCPVITTDIRALSEINGENRGWLINTPKNHLSEAFYQTEEQRKQLSDTIKTQLEEIVLSISMDKDQVKVKGANALKYIETNHNPKEYSKKIEQIYLNALN